MSKMPPRASYSTLKCSSRGFTLIELIIVVTIVGVLASLALPEFSRSVMQSHRTEARAALEEIRNLEMEFFQTFKQFGSRDEIGYSNAVTPGGFYQVSVASATLAFSATATAIGNQLKDEDCRIFSVTTTGTYEATDSNGDPSPECW